jgi:predicted transcriptional regulator
MEKQVAVRSRTDFPSAVQQVLKVLSDGRPYTLNRLAREANLNFRTVKKVIEMLEQTRQSLQSKSVEVSATSDNHMVVQTREKSGFASLPEDLRRTVIRALYPQVTDEERVLVRLLKRGAVSKRTAVVLPEEPALDTLVEAEHVIRSGAKFYLTSAGQIIAKGALSIYPELGDL